MSTIKIQQMALVSAILMELGHQHKGLKISQEQLNTIISAANDICTVFIERNLCDSCNDSLRGGCSSICSNYKKDGDYEHK